MAECTPPSIEFLTNAGCRENPNAEEVPWRTENDEYSPFIDPRNCRYSIVVDKAYKSLDDTNEEEQYESLGPASRRGRRVRKYAAYGVDKLVRFFSKSFGEGALADITRTALINNAVSAFFEYEGTPYVLPMRPNSKMKVLITVDYNLFRELPDASYTPDYGEGVNVLAARYDVRLIKTKIEFVANVLKEYYDLGNRNLFRSPQVDLKEEAEKTISFLSYLQRFLIYNELDLELNSVASTREEYIEFITNEDTFELLDIIYTDQAGQEKYLRAGWPTMGPQQKRVAAGFTTTGTAFTTIDYYPSETSPRTMALIYWIAREIFLLFNNHINPSSKEFIERYIYPPVDTNMSIGSRFGVTQQNLRDVDAGAQKVAQVLGYTQYGFDILNGRQRVVPLLDSYVKTWAELQLENDSIESRAFQSNLANQTDDIVRITDSSPLIDWAVAWDRLDGNIENLYRLVLNHVDVRYIFGKIAQCSSNLSEDAFELDENLLELLSRLAEYLLFLANMDYSTFRFPSNWAAIGLDITEDLANYVVNFIVNLVNIALTEGVLSLLRLLDELCDDELDYDTIDVESLLSNNFNTTGEAANFYNRLSSALGGSGPLLRELIRDISVLLSTGELCSLLNGSASGEVLAVAHNVVLTEKYIPFQQRFKTKNDLALFFKSLGTLFDPSICEVGRLVPGDYCSPGFNEQEMRRLLGEKQGITPDQVEQQIEERKRQRRELLEKFDKIINSTEGDLSQKLLDVLGQGEISNQIASHPSTKEAVNQMTQTLFISPMVTMLEEGLGILETRYTSVQLSTPIPGFSFGEEFAVNKGIMDVVTSPEGYAFYTLGLTKGPAPGFDLDPDELNVSVGDGLIEQLSRINLNPNTTPDSTLSVSVDDPNDIPLWWGYNINLHKVIGSFSISPLASKDNIYETKSAPIPSWWTLPPSMTQMDNPQIKTFFITRNPIAGFDEREPAGNVPGPMLNPLNPNELSLITDPSDKYLRSGGDVTINVFTDFPKILEQRLASEEFVSFTVGNKQQTIYTNSFIRNARRITTTLDTEITNVATAREIAATYKNTFNDVMRILYRFVPDSLVHANNDYIILPALREKFKNPDEVVKLLGLQEIEDTIQNNVADAITQNENLAESSKDVIGESALRFLIRIYLVEFFVKNIYTFINSPENTARYGKTVIRNAADLSGERVVLLNTGNPVPGAESGSTAFFNRTLDLTQIQDSVMVSYILEYMKFSDNRIDSCSAFYDIAVRLADGELERTEEAYLQVTSGMFEDDTMAYYPARRAGTLKRDAALKYYIAKELKSFLPTLQQFVELKDLVDYPATTVKRSLMEAFLDKFQILGHNVRPEDYETWRDLGEGLYMDFYVRGALTEDSEEKIHLFNSLYDSESRPRYDFADDFKVGIRINVRDCAYHEIDSAERFVSTDISRILSEHFSFSRDNGVAERENNWTREKGFPIVEVERTWGQIREEIGMRTNSPYQTVGDQRLVLDYMKQQVTQSIQFRLLFEYAFPVKKLFNFLMIIMDQGVSAFLTNTGIRGVELGETPDFEPDREPLVVLPDGTEINRRQILNASCIDPEQFKNAKGLAKSILENVVNSNNYRHTNSQVQEAGGIANLVLSNSLESL